ncbi:MAG: beta-lactamase family protein [Chloroflexota bacterium]|nr:beta-lactamase family protein [Chloroflexota bacterium]
MLLEDLLFLDELAAVDRLSGAILVAMHGEPLFTKAYGLANKEKKLPNQIDTRFNLGSMNKMFTGIAIAQLAQCGKLSFGDPISKYLPGFQGARGHEITLHHLLTHTSGLGNYMADERYATLKANLDSVQDLMPLIDSEPLQSEPGSRFLYSNSGYIVLGAAIEKVAAQSYFDYIQEHIFDVASMSKSGFYRRDDEAPDIAHSYTAMDMSMPGSMPGARSTPDREPSSSSPANVTARQDSRSYMSGRGGPAGGGYSTVEDMLRFSRALLEHRLLSPDYTERVTTGKVGMLGPNGVPLLDRKYGYGFSDGEVEGVRIVGHNGGGPGVNAQCDIYPQLGYTVVILANYDGVLPLILNKVRRAIINAKKGFQVAW